MTYKSYRQRPLSQRGTASVKLVAAASLTILSVACWLLWTNGYLSAGRSTNNKTAFAKTALDSPHKVDLTARASMALAVLSSLEVSPDTAGIRLVFDIEHQSETAIPVLDLLIARVICTDTQSIIAEVCIGKRMNTLVHPPSYLEPALLQSEPEFPTDASILISDRQLAECVSFIDVQIMTASEDNPNEMDVWASLTLPLDK